MFILNFSDLKEQHEKNIHGPGKALPEPIDISDESLEAFCDKEIIPNLFCVERLSTEGTRF